MGDLKSLDVQAMSDYNLKKVITDGKGNKMKPIASASASAADMVAYVEARSAR